MHITESQAQRIWWETRADREQGEMVHLRGWPDPDTLGMWPNIILLEGINTRIIFFSSFVYHLVLLLKRHF